jgi:hypothetical protein
MYILADVWRHFNVEKFQIAKVDRFVFPTYPSRSSVQKETRMTDSTSMYAPAPHKWVFSTRIYSR